MPETVRAWEEPVVIPTYEVGAPEKNPMFLEKRVYQGSSGVVYPHAVIEKIYDEKKNKTYRALYLENEYLKIMILPELGGRIQMAYDKVKQRHFVYYNQVIKPALVGLTGPWISGGIEFNWPQHHRPSTFEPVDFTITEQADGSKTVWLNEVERMFRTKGLAGITLYPGKAYIEITGKLYNRTPFPQTFLWWANPAVKVNEHYQSIFPPDVDAVFDHGKRDVSAFPIARGVYYKVDYAPGTDISRYSNIPVPTSYMAVSSRYNFIGGYEHDTGGGLLHVADHHIAPGKKQWTWGHGEFGQAWDRNLTDEDGPYIELMTGVYTDNQPDFSWIQPYEEKSFVQYFMPYQEVGAVKNASKDAVLKVEVSGMEVLLKLYVTGKFPELEVSIRVGEQILYRDVIASAPESPYTRNVALKAPVAEEELLVTVTDLAAHRQLVKYSKGPSPDEKIPFPAEPAIAPEKIESTEELFLTGSHLEQYRHATYLPTDYYNEALKRTPGDIRNNNAMGLWYLRRGQPEKAEPYFRTAIATLTKRNPNPYDGEPYYNLGWALKMQGQHEEAFEAFYKSVWNDGWQHAGYLNLARQAVLMGDLDSACELIDRSLIKNYHSHSARHARVFILRKLNRTQAAAALIEESLSLDPFNFGCLFEKYLLLKERPEASAAFLLQLRQLSRDWDHNFIEYAFDYAHAGLFVEAGDLLSLYEAGNPANTMVKYYQGWFAFQAGRVEEAKAFFSAAALSADFVFPNRIEDVPVFKTAIELNPVDAKAWYYLGNFWYDKRQYAEAIACWEGSIRIDDGFPTAHRNLSLAYYNKLNDPHKALQALETAFSLDPTDARVLMELDQLYKKMNKGHRERLKLLEEHIDLVQKRDDLYLERVTLYNQLGKHAKAKQLIAAYQFHPWEGGEGKVVGQYLICHLELAKDAIANEKFDEAIQLLQAAENYPPNLGEGKLTGVQENDIHYWLGLAFGLSGDQDKAAWHYRQATCGISEPAQAIFYNDPQPDKIVYQGLSWIKLGDRQKATAIFQRLIEFGRAHLDDHISIDYFAVSLPDLLVFDADLDLMNRIHCLYLMALGNLGLGSRHADRANDLLNEVLQLDNNHQGALGWQRSLPRIINQIV